LSIVSYRVVSCRVVSYPVPSRDVLLPIQKSYYYYFTTNGTTTTKTTTTPSAVWIFISVCIWGCGCGCGCGCVSYNAINGTVRTIRNTIRNTTQHNTTNYPTKHRITLCYIIHKQRTQHQTPRSPFQDGGRRRGRWPPGPGVFAGRKRETGLRGSDRNRGCARIDLRTDPGQEQQQQLVTSSSLANAMQCKERVSDCKERPKSRASGTYSNAIQYNAMPQYNTKAATIPDCDDSIVPHYYSVLRCVIATSNDISYHIIPYHTIPYCRVVHHNA